MTAKNDHTGASMNTKAATDMYREGYDRIFGKKTKVTAPLQTRQEIHDEIVRQSGTEFYSPPLHGGAPNSPIVADGYAQREKLGLHTESVLDHLAHRDAQMSDREWAAQPANLREGCIKHVDGVGDI